MKPSISIVYSEIHVLQSLNNLFTEAGFQTYPYYSTEEALAWAHIKHPDIYLINHKNTPLNGVEFYKELKERIDSYSLSPKAIFISSKYETEEECREVGGLDFISCPYEPKEVLELITKYIRLNKSLN